MKTIIFVLLVLIAVLPMFSGQVVSMPDLVKPVTLVVDDNQLYVTEGISVYIYARKDLKLIKKFGKKGEGPREFMENPQFGQLVINVDTKNIVVYSPLKVSQFTKSGDYISEMRVQDLAISFFPFEAGYVAMGFTNVDNVMYRAVTLYDGKLGKLKELFKIPHDFQQGQGLKAFQTAYNYIPYNGKLYITWDKNFVIRVFDPKGNLIQTVKHDYRKLKVSEKDKKDVIEFLKTNPQTKQFYEFLKPIKFPEYLPVIRDMRIADDKMYVITFKEKQEKSEMIILDLDGKILDTRLIEFEKMDGLQFYPYTISQGKVYQLVENIDEEEWELHINKL